jgi:hypothetical protein
MPAARRLCASSGRFWRNGHTSLAHIGFQGRGIEDGVHLNLSRLNHRLPGRKAHSEVVQGTIEFHHEITDTLLPERIRSFTMRPRFTLLLTCSIRSLDSAGPGWPVAAPMSTPVLVASWSA